ncbi:hypothetical protein GINT2_001190 [Glugoides intestinalis]
MRRRVHKEAQPPIRFKEFPGKEVISHIVFYFVRLLCFVFLHDDYSEIKSVQLLISIKKDAIVSGLFGMFQLYVLLNGLISNNIYGYYVATLLIFHNFLLILVIHVVLRFERSLFYFSVGCLLAFCYFAEFVATVIFIIKKRSAHSMFLFQKIGSDPIINKLYATRMRLAALGFANIFVPAVVLAKQYIPPLEKVIPSDAIIIVIFLISLIQQLLISVNIHDEDILQRKVAIFFTILKGLLIIIDFAFTIKIQLFDSEANKIIKLILCMDILIINTAFLRYMLLDMKGFSHGLKEALLFKTRRLKL